MRTCGPQYQSVLNIAARHGASLSIVVLVLVLKNAYFPLRSAISVGPYIAARHGASLSIAVLVLVLKNAYFPSQYDGKRLPCCLRQARKQESALNCIGETASGQVCYHENMPEKDFSPGTDVEQAALEFFRPDGPVARAVGRYEERPQQVQMAFAVARSLDSCRHLVVEAGTGVGKSISYLAPAALWALKRGKRVVVATYTKALQEQLIKKDIPGLACALADGGMEIKSALLMGSENYLCLRRLELARRKSAGFLDSAQNMEFFHALAAAGENSDSGLRQDLPKVSESAWENVCRESELCAGKSCPWRDSCLWRKDVARARASQLVVANQHLFFSGMYAIPWDAVIIDEAHNMEEVSAQYLGASLSSYEMRRLLEGIFSSSRKGCAARMVSDGLPEGLALSDAVACAERGAEQFFASAARFAGVEAASAEGRSVRVTVPCVIEDTLSPELENISRAISESLARAADLEEELALKASRERALSAMTTVRAFLKCDRRDCAYHIETRFTRGRLRAEVSITPLDVSRELADTLFGLDKPVVLTSATLAVDGKFDYFRSRVGLEECTEKIISSPFDYKKQAALLTVRDMPSPRQEPLEYEKAVIRSLKDIIASVDGGIFLLFTSWNLLSRAAGELLRDKGSRQFFIQGELPPASLIKEFKHVGNAVLFATDTFWQGVDVPGKALSCVVITRLPFLAPDSPVEQARAELYAQRGLDMFSEYTLPRAVIKFHQGFGRLIRRKSDRGAVVVLDPRILTMDYGAKFLRAVPSCLKLASVEELRGFFAGH